MTTQPLLPTGKDCDCGHPMIWHHDEQRCAVYGTHGWEQVIADVPWPPIRRNMAAPAARLIDELTAMTWPGKGLAA